MTTSPKPIKRDPRIEKMRNKHLKEMHENRYYFKKFKDNEMRQQYQDEFLEMVDDLIEFDTYFCDEKYVIMNEDTKRSRHIYVNLDTGEGWSGKPAAMKAAGMKKSAFEKEMVKYDPRHPSPWRKITNGKARDAKNAG